MIPSGMSFSVISGESATPADRVHLGALGDPDPLLDGHGGDRRHRVASQVVRRWVLRGLILAWILASIAALSAQRYRATDDVPLSTQLAIERERNSNAAAIADIRQNLAVVTKIANDAKDEIHEMRVAVWGCAGTILISLFMQLAQMRKGKAG